MNKYYNVWPGNARLKSSSIKHLADDEEFNPNNTWDGRYKPSMSRSQASFYPRKSLAERERTLGSAFGSRELLDGQRILCSSTVKMPLVPNYTMNEKAIKEKYQLLNALRKEVKNAEIRK